MQLVCVLTGPLATVCLQGLHSLLSCLLLENTSTPLRPETLHRSSRSDFVRLQAQTAFADLRCISALLETLPRPVLPSLHMSAVLASAAAHDLHPLLTGFLFLLLRPGSRRAALMHKAIKGSAAWFWWLCSMASRSVAPSFLWTVMQVVVYARGGRCRGECVLKS